MNLSAKIEAILFWKAEPVSFEKISSLLNVDLQSVRSALVELENNLRGRGVSLIYTDEEAMLGTAEKLSPLIKQIAKDELTKDLGKAGLETLSIILYQGPISRSEIDYIRGVNSQFTLRALLIRGLAERIENPKDARSYLYKPTISLLSYLGISKIQDLPEYQSVQDEIESFKKIQTEVEQKSDTIES